MRNLGIYIKERFPVLQALLFSLGMVGLAIGVTSEPATMYDGMIEITRRGLLSVSAFFFFLLRQRITDEFKDAEYDLVNYPGRAVPRGLVTKSTLIFIGCTAFGLELICVYLLPNSLYYVPFLLYSLLMNLEFFAARWLKQHFTTYFISHELIFIPLGIFWIAALTGQSTLHASNVAILLLLLLAAMEIEVLRKFSPRFDGAGTAVADTYSTVWGRGKAFSFLLFLVASQSILLSILKSNLLFLIIGALITAVISIVCRRDDHHMKILVAGHFLIQSLLVNRQW